MTTAAVIPTPGQRRRQHRLVALVVALAVVVGLLTWSRFGAGEAQAASGLTTVPSAWSPGVGAYGIAVGTTITFEHDRMVTRGRIVSATAAPESYVGFTPQDGTDEERGYPLPRVVDAGVTVAVEATVLPSCGVEVTSVPVFEIDSRPDDGLLTPVHALVSDPRTDAVPVADLSAWQRAVQEWCATGVHAFASEASSTPEGEVTQTLTVYNPGPDAATVVCPAGSDGDGSWEHAEVTVPGGTVGDLTVHGTHADIDAVPPLTANGAPVPVLD